MKVNIEFRYELECQDDSEMYDFVEKQIKTIELHFGLNKWRCIEVDLKEIPNVGEFLSFCGGDLFSVTWISHSIEKESHDIFIHVKYGGF